MRRLAFIAALLVFTATVAPVPAVAAGTTRWVDPAGSDANAGTQASPWRTLQHAVDQADPGDTILVNPGTYSGMRIERSGAPGAWITLRAAADGVVIDRPGPENRHDSNIELETWSSPGTVSYWIIEGLEVRDAPNWGIDVRGSSGAHSHHITIRNNEVHHNGLVSTKTGIFFAFTDHIRVVGNESHHNGEHGVYVSNSGDRFRVSGNHLHHNDRCGLHMNGDLSQGGDGIISRGQITGNLIEENGSEGCAGINLDGVTRVRITDNVIVENHATGIAVFRQDGAVCSRKVTIANNTIVQATDGRWAVVMGGPGCREVTLIANVILTRHPWRGVIEMPDPSLPGLHSDHNVVTGRFTTDGGNTVLDLDEWESATGQDGASVAATISAVLTTGSYRHRPDGPAQDTGVGTASKRDHDGIRRPVGSAPDIGAFETPMCHGKLATIVGTPGADVIVGSEDDDVVVALAGADQITLLGGSDVACGGKGGDSIHGGDGTDRLYGQRGNDDLDGGPGHDVVAGGTGHDTCIGEVTRSCE